MVEADALVSDPGVSGLSNLWPAKDTLRPGNAKVAPPGMEFAHSISGRVIGPIVNRCNQSHAPYCAEFGAGVFARYRTVANAKPSQPFAPTV